LRGIDGRQRRGRQHLAVAHIDYDAGSALRLEALNSIGQFRWLWNHQLGSSIGFFIGPTANVMISQLRNPETGIIKSSVVPYTLIDEDLTANTNLKAWVGVNAGFRF